MSMNESLLDVARSGDTDTVKALVAEGASLNAKDEDGWTALMWTAFCGRTDAVKALIDAGAEVNAKAEDGWTDLIYAASCQRIKRTICLPADALIGRNLWSLIRETNRRGQ